MATHYETLLVTREKGITTIAFNRPEKRNAMSPQLHKEMFELLTELRYDEETRVVILTGAGENFCAGQDLKQYSLELENQPARARRHAAHFAQAGDRAHHRLVPGRRADRDRRLRHRDRFGGRALRPAGSELRPFSRGRNHGGADRASPAQARALLRAHRQDDDGARGGAARPDLAGGAARGARQGGRGPGPVSRRKKSAGAQSREGRVVLQLLCVARRRLRDFQPDFRAHHPRPRRASRPRAVRAEKTSPDLRGDEGAERIISPRAAAATDGGGAISFPAHV